MGDLFCGGGGFSQGFAQSGFRVAWGVDNWRPAVETFERNHPGALGIQADILSMDPKVLPRVDILLGSPPCVHFSAANRGGSGDREKGMELVRRALEIVRILNPKYWLIENVPAMLSDLEAEMQEGTFDLGNSKFLPIPVRKILDSAEFGAPQTRKRLFSGNFPVPGPNHSYEDGTVVPLSRVIRGLPQPWEPVRQLPGRIADPNYSSVKVAAQNLRDHFDDTRWQLSKAELESSRYWKQNNPVYGKMAFPDSIDRPCRTITATRTRGSRSTIVIPCEGRAGRKILRTLTLRECASAQGFPISYQFWGQSVSDKDFLVGNAVSPHVSMALANEIRRKEDLPVPPSPLIRSPVDLPPPIQIRRTGPRRFSLRRRFRGTVPIEWRHDHRVELDNEVSTAHAALPYGVLPPILWRTRVYLGYAKLYKRYDLDLSTALTLARAVLEDPLSGVGKHELSLTLKSTVNFSLGGLTDGVTLQKVWAGWISHEHGPQQVLSSVANATREGFPPSNVKRLSVAPSITARVLEPCLTARGDDSTPGQPVAMSARLLASAIGLAVVCARLNLGPEVVERIQRALDSKKGIQSDLVRTIIAEYAGTGRRGGRQSSLRIR